MEENVASRWSPLRIAIFFGLATGFAEELLVLFRQYILHKFVWTPAFHAWAAPAIYAVLFGILGLVFVALSYAWPRINKFAPVVFACIGFFILTMQFAQIGRFAGFLLSLGIATQLIRVVGARRGGFERVGTRPIAVMAGCVVLIATALPIGRRGIEAWQLQRLGDARAGAPNIVFIILDTVRAASLGLHGGPVANTKHLEQWAARGVIFDHAIAPSSWTLPSHASMFTGKWVHELDVHWGRPLMREHRTVAEILKANGYATGAFVANDRYTFADAGLKQGFIRYDDYQFTTKEVLRSPVLMQTSMFRSLSTAQSLRTVVWAIKEFNLNIPTARWGQRKNAPAVRENFLAWAASVPDDRPFFVFLNYFDAHSKYRCPREVRSNFDCSTKLNTYQASIAYLDIELDKLFREMESNGLMKNTVVIVTSDHGEQFGERGLVDHGNSLYQPALHIPLLVFGTDRFPAGRRVSTPVSGRDLAATMLDLAGVPASQVPGTSLSKYWSEAGAIGQTDPLFAQITSTAFAKRRFAGGHARISVFRGDRQYILNAGGREEVFVFSTDTTAARNLYGLPAERSLIDWARQQVVPIVVEQGAPTTDLPGQR